MTDRTMSQTPEPSVDPDALTVMVTGATGIKHRIAWDQGILKVFKAIL